MHVFWTDSRFGCAGVVVADAAAGLVDDAEVLGTWIDTPLPSGCAGRSSSMLYPMLDR